MRNIFLIKTLKTALRHLHHHQHAICRTMSMKDPKEVRQTICIIDDDKIQHFAIEKSIQLQGLSKKMLSFLDGEEAIAFFNENLSNSAILPDVVILDINMPVVNGWQFLKEYASFKEKIDKNIKIYVVSSSINPVEIHMATTNACVSGFLSKPLKPEDIKHIFLS